LCLFINLGSIDTITDGKGNIVERMAYTAFGERRKGDWRVSDPLPPIIPALTNRGFTGHEHIDEMGLISLGNRCRYKSKGTIPIWISVFKWIVHYITVSIVTLGIVRGLDWDI
jgi:hypothetical protein